jgi:ligand-binding sensor domain-containing protein/signal transduction histidine kinase
MFCHSRTLLWLWLALIFWGAVADPKKVSAASVATNFARESPFVCRTWRAEVGLPQESVWAITQTKDGYLWIGTGGGLARFDGARFEVFGIQDGLPSMQIHSLLEDRSGALWIGTANGISRFQNGIFSSWTRRDGLAGESVTQLAEDGDGNIWIGSNLGLSRWRNGKIENIGAAAGLAEADVRAVIADAAGKIWVSLVSEGLMRFDGTNFVSARNDAELRQLRPYRLLCDHRGNILAATVGKIYSIGETNWTVFGAAEGLPDVLISCLAESADGTLWVGTSDQGMLFLRGKNFHPLRHTDGLSDDAVRSIAHDSEGNLWAGTRGAGLNRLQPRKLSTQKLFDGTTEVQPISLAETGDGSLWVGTIGHGLHRFHGDAHEVLLRDELLPGNLQVSALLAAHDGSLWVVGGSTLFHWSDGALRPECQVNGVQSLCEDKDGSLLLGNEKGILQRYVHGQLESVTTQVNGFAISSIVAAADGAFWVATYSHGLAFVSGGVCKMFGRADGLQSELLRGLFLDKKNVLWIGTEGGGLSRMENGKIFSFGRAQGIPDQTILQILEDDDGWLWLGTQHGIVRVARAALEAVAAGKAERVFPTVFGRYDGMLTEQCSGNPGAGLKTRSGLVCFSTGRGVVSIDPKLQNENAAAPAVRIQRVLVDNQPAEISPAHAHDGKNSAAENILRVAPGNQRVDFFFTGLFFSAPERVKFRYRLEGFDNGWIEPGAQRNVYYTHLPPGNYTFTVAAHNGNGHWSEQVASVSLAVPPFFWQRKFFLALLALLFAVVIAGTVRRLEKRKAWARLKKLELAHAMEAERTRIAQDIHDDIGAGLTEIGLTSELVEDPALPPDEARQFAREISLRSRELVASMDEIVWAINPRYDTVKSSVAYFSQFADRMFKPAGIRCRMEVQPDLAELPLTSEQRHNLFLGFKEALNNILKHARAHEVRLGAKLDENVFVFSVTDDGVGFEHDAGGEAQDGLTNLRERLKKIGGSCEIKSAGGQGTRIVFRLPLPDKISK